MRNPNGWGSVVKLKGNRRRPYYVRKTIGFNEKGHPIYAVLGYYATREEGMIALAEYNQFPYDLSFANITFKELYDKWLQRDGVKIEKRSLYAFKSAANHCSRLFNVPYRTIKAYQMQQCIDECGFGYAVKNQIKNLFGKLDRYALEFDIIKKKNSELTHSAPITVAKEQIPFTADEINTLWEVSTESWVGSILFMLYTGFRITETLEILKSNVNIEEWTVKGGLKTVNGKNRIVPIHPRLRPIILEQLEIPGITLFPSARHKVLETNKYYDYWNIIMERYNMHHNPHECRHTFRSLLDSAGANKVCIDLLMGHKSIGTGERVYTHKTLQELRDTINLLN